MSRDLFSKKIKAILEIADDEGFVELLWASDALQAGFSDAATPYLMHGSFLPAAITEQMSDRAFIYKWELETLANEILTVPKRTLPKRGKVKRLNTSNYGNIVTLVNYLRKLENSEAGKRTNDKNIFFEMARIANRQFDWQRGYFNVPQFYRNTFIYGQGDCAAYFQSKYGITVNQLSLVGFGIYSSMIINPIFNRFQDMDLLGITPKDLSAALSLISQSCSDARQAATDVRSHIYQIAYRPSILRQRPCVSFGEADQRIRAPLPQLILERVTSGIFYDVVGGGGAIQADYGKRFEEYCLMYFQRSLPALEWAGEKIYKVGQNEVRSSDILCLQQGQVKVAIECKASRMSYNAKFGDDPVTDRGFAEIIRGVYQLWRFFSHCRRGLCDLQISDEATGVLLTLDGWLTMANPLQMQVMDAARQLADERDTQILEQDRRPIAFVSITDLEATLSRATEQTFLQAIRNAATPAKEGWMLNSVHSALIDTDEAQKKYPFKDDMAELLPWWGAVEEAKNKANL